MKYKLFVDGRSFDTEYQGTRTFIQNIYSEIDKIGDFELYIASEDAEKTSHFFKSSINTHFIQYKTKSKLQRAFNEIPSLLSKYNIDAAHYQYVSSPGNKGLKIVTTHDILFKDFPDEFDWKYKMIKGWAFYWSAKNAGLLTTVSEYSRKAISKHYKIAQKKIHVIPNGVSPFYCEPYNKEKSREIVFEKFLVKDYLLYVSRIEPRKNQLALLQSYLQLRLYEKNKSLVFVGKKSIPVPQIDAIMNTLGSHVKRNILFLENISNSDLRRLYQAADLFVYPSKAEGFGIPPLEAGALEVPTICSNSTAMAEFTFFGKHHISPDVPLLTAAIKEFYDGGQLNLKSISNTITKSYSWQNSAKKLNELIWDKIRE